MKKLLFLLIPSISLGILFFGLFQYFVKSHSQKGALQITSVPESSVYLGDKYIGKTPLCKCEAADLQRVGDYTLRLIPNGKDLHEFQEKITISEGTLTVVDRTFGKDSLSDGSVISLTPLSDKKHAELLVVSIPTKSKIFLDNNQIGQTPFLFKNPTESDHVLEVSKEGYKEKNVRIRTPVGYKLTVVTYLSTGGSPKIATESAVLLPTTTIVPTPTSSKVVILDTPTGFLRVRETNSLGGAEIGRISAPDEYELVGEQSGWYQIKLKDGKTGWISAQYAKKQ